MEDKPETNSVDGDGHAGKERNNLLARWIDKLKPRGKPGRRHFLVVAAVMICAYSILVVMSDLAQSVAISTFYEHLSIHTQSDKRECGDRRKVYQINAHYSDVLLLKRSPEVTAKAAILEDGPCLSALLKSLHDAEPGIRAVIGERNTGTKSVLVEIIQP